MKKVEGDKKSYIKYFGESPEFKDAYSMTMIIHKSAF
jgi:hypothetical protein